MSFVLVKTTSAATRINVNLPTDKVDVTRAVSFVARFNVLPQSEIDAFVDDDRKVSQVLDDNLIGLEEIVDESGKPIDFAVAKAAVLDDTRIHAALWRAYMDLLSGAKAKNSKK